MSVPYRYWIPSEYFGFVMATTLHSFSYETSPLFGISRYCPSFKVRLQEVEEKERGGRVPRTVDIELFEDLCDSCVPGDVVTVTGVVKVGRFQRSGSGSSISSESGYRVLMTKNGKNIAETF
jgi:DNA helicase MCM8